MGVFLIFEAIYVGFARDISVWVCAWLSEFVCSIGQVERLIEWREDECYRICQESGGIPASKWRY